MRTLEKLERNNVLVGKVSLHLDDEGTKGRTAGNVHVRWNAEH